MNVAIVDYGSGNLHSAAQGVRARGARSRARSDRRSHVATPNGSRAADRIVLPGVGAFADCRRGLDGVPGMVEALEEAVRERGRPFLGICVGMQLMATRGLEHEVAEGLDWIRAMSRRSSPPIPRSKFRTWAGTRCSRAAPAPAARRHRDRRERPARLFRAFLSTHAAHHADLVSPMTDYGGPITAMVGRDNMVGTQFHPEKSQTLGLALIANFLKWRP